MFLDLYSFSNSCWFVSEISEMFACGNTWRRQRREALDHSLIWYTKDSQLLSVGRGAIEEFCIGLPLRWTHLVRVLSDNKNWTSEVTLSSIGKVILEVQLMLDDCGSGGADPWYLLGFGSITTGYQDVQYKMAYPSIYFKSCLLSIIPNAVYMLWIVAVLYCLGNDDKKKVYTCYGLYLDF